MCNCNLATSALAGHSHWTVQSISWEDANIINSCPHTSRRCLLDSWVIHSEVKPLSAKFSVWLGVDMIESWEFTSQNWRPVSTVKELSNVSAQCRTFINGRSNTWHGMELYTQPQRKMVVTIIFENTHSHLHCHPHTFLPTFSSCVCACKSPCHVLDLPLMKALHWAKTSGNSLTFDIGTQFIFYYSFTYFIRALLLKNRPFITWHALIVPWKISYWADVCGRQSTGPTSLSQHSETLLDALVVLTYTLNTYENFYYFQTLELSINWNFLWCSQEVPINKIPLYLHTVCKGTVGHNKWNEGFVTYWACHDIWFG